LHIVLNLALILAYEFELRLLNSDNDIQSFINVEESELSMSLTKHVLAM